MQNTDLMPRNEKKAALGHKLRELIVKEFVASHSNLDVNSLTPTRPTSLKDVKLAQKEMAQLNLHPVVLSTLCGTTFGDSSLKVQKNYKNARLSYKHSTRQKDWFLWKTLCAFKEFTTEDGIQFQLPDGFQKEAIVADGECLGKLKMSTKVDTRLTKLRDIIAPNNNKTISRFWLNHMNDYFLMTLWLDDGGLTGGLGCQGVISTGSMPLAQVKLLADYLKTVWGISCDARELEAQPMVNGQLVTRLFIKDQENLQKFLRIIAPIIPVQSMLYKVCFFPDDVSLQERWASELKQLVRSEWHDALDQIFWYKTLKSLS